jgi:hypothetical protein
MFLKSFWVVTWRQFLMYNQRFGKLVCPIFRVLYTKNWHRVTTQKLLSNFICNCLPVDMVSQKQIWVFWDVMICRLVNTIIVEQHIASVFSVGQLDTMILQKFGYCLPVKHSVTSQKIFIHTTLRVSNPAYTRRLQFSSTPLWEHQMSCCVGTFCDASDLKGGWNDSSLWSV